MEPTLRIGRAKPTSEHLNAILGLIDEAREWLPSKGTNQWSEPWPDRAQRDARVFRGLELGATWVVWERMHGKDILAATVTITGKPNPAVWSPQVFDLAERTVYAHRLITARRYAGWDLGGDLLDWIGCRGRRNYGARWIRIDVWTFNEALHNYYMKRGFKLCGTCADETYPSGVLLQKSVSGIPYSINPQFAQSDDVPNVFSAAGQEDPAYDPYAPAAVDAASLIPATPADLKPTRIGAGPPDPKNRSGSNCWRAWRHDLGQATDSPLSRGEDHPLRTPAGLGWVRRHSSMTDWIFWRRRQQPHSPRATG